MSSRCNLQALREIDAQGVSFLKVGVASGDSYGERQSYGRGTSGGGTGPSKPSRESCLNQSCTRVGLAKPLMSQIGFNVA
jgi:hypothetical protein